MFSVCACFGSMDAMHFFKRCFWELNICLDLWFSSLLDCIHFYVFFLSLSFIKLDSFSIDPWQIAIYRDPWTSFLDRSYCIFNPSKLFGFCLNSFSTDSLSIKKVFVWPIASRSIKAFLSLTNSWQHLDRFYLSRFSARQILNPSSCNFFK